MRINILKKMNWLKKGEGLPLLNFVGSPAVALLNFDGGPGVPLFNFRGVSGPGSHFYTMPPAEVYVWSSISRTII